MAQQKTSRKKPPQTKTSQEKSSLPEEPQANAAEDITERQRAEEALQRAHDELEQRVLERTADLERTVEQLQWEIAERQRTEEALKESEERYRGIFENANLAIFQSTLEGNLVNANPACAHMLGYDSPEELIAAIHHTGQQLYADPGQREEIIRTTQRNVGIAKEVGFIRKDGQKGVANVNFRVVQYVGQPQVYFECFAEDITERRRAEEALKSERQRLFTLLNELPASVCLIAPDHTLFYCNRLFGEIFGEPQGRPCYEVMRGRREPCENCPTFQVFETNQRRIWEWTTPGKQTFQMYDYPFADIDGSPLVLQMGIDITERKRVEENLRESEARLAEAQRIAHLGDWEYNIQSGEVTWSEETNRMIGVDKESFVPSPEAAMSFIHPEDRTRVKEIYERSLAGEAGPYNMVYRIVRPNGEIRYFQSKAEIILDGQGRPWRQVGIAQDITERRIAEMRLKESEARFRAVYERAALGISLLDLQGRFLSANKAVQEMLGYGEEELRGKLVMELIHADDRNRNLQLFLGMASGRQESLQMEKRFRRKDGQYIWGRVTASLVQDSEGKPLYAVGMVEDITQRKQAETRLQESEEKLHYLASQLLLAQENERNRLASELHDELGHALLTLKLALRAIAEELLPTQENIKQEIQDQLAYIDEVIEEVRRLYHDLCPGNLEDLGLTEALHTLVEDFAGLQGHIAWEVDLPNLDGLFSLPVQTIIYRLIQEALTNIGKHANPEHVTVSATKEASQVHFIIQDDGRGFDVGQVPGGHGAGRGVGLVAMEERLNMVGGSFDIQSREQEGTRLSFTIPILPEGGRP